MAHSHESRLDIRAVGPTGASANNLAPNRLEPKKTYAENIGADLKQHHLVRDESKVWEYDIVSFFEKKGVRWTPQRQLVLDALQRSQGHISAEEIHHQIIRQFPKVNLSTIYRTLELLCEMGVMVEVVSRNDDRKRFELVGELPHHHLICLGCGVAMELEELVVQRLKIETLEHYGFKLELNHFVGYGCCASCAKSGFHLS